MADFVLEGDDGDETRILRDRTSGYSVALVGHPALVLVPDGPIRYDVIVELADVEVDHGFRIDIVPSTMSPESLAAAFATAYATNRAKAPPVITEIPAAYLPAGAVGGSRSQYRVRDSETDVERVWIATKPSPSGLWVLYHTTRASLDQVNPMSWSHLLSTMNGQQRWGDEAMRAPIWPSSEIALTSARLALTEAEHTEAVAKARELGGQEPPSGLVVWLSLLAQTDDPPAHAIALGRVETIHEQLGSRAPDMAQILIRGLDRCRTALDLRAWAWQCVWAIGNR
ncbi:MAG: hypothetical protein ABI867_41395 [Kofleriaceae bacterium]